METQDVSGGKPLLLDDHCAYLVEIAPQVFVGTSKTARDMNGLMGCGITHIVNATKELKNSFPESFEYFRIPVEDSRESNIQRYFEPCFEFIDKALKRGPWARVLIHCRGAKSRSASMVLAYKMRALKSPLKLVFDETSEIACLRINDGFKRQLMDYEYTLYRRNSLNFFPPRQRKASYCEFSSPEPKKAKKLIDAKITDYFIDATPILIE